MCVKDFKLDRMGKFKQFFILIFMLVTLFFSERDLLFPYYFRISTTLLIAILIIICVFLLSFVKNVKFDFISITLLARMVLYLLPVLYTESMYGYWGNYLTVVASFFAYFISSQYSFKENKTLIERISLIFMLSLVIISIQVIYMNFLLADKFGFLSINLFKFHLELPLGSSNYIASVILPLLVFVIYAEINNKVRIASSILAVIALIIIQSKNAFIVLFFFLAFKLIVTYFKVLRMTNENRRNVISLTIFLFIALSGILIFSVYFLLNEWNMGMVVVNGTFLEIINALSSNRLYVFSNEFSRWTNNFMFGNGLGYEVGAIRSHNWLLELLVQSGIVGLLLYISILTNWYSIIKVQRNSSRFFKAVFSSVVIILIQGLAEVSMFTMTIDVLLWFLIGLSVSEVKSIKVNRKGNRQIFTMCNIRST